MILLLTVANKFRKGMADYQHVVAVHADIARRKKKKSGEVEEPPFGKSFLTFLISPIVSIG